ncbi:hypothetical protein ACOMHN_047630 [Nucella lapillus]
MSQRTPGHFSLMQIKGRGKFRAAPSLTLRDLWVTGVRQGRGLGRCIHSEAHSGSGYEGNGSVTRDDGGFRWILASKSIKNLIRVLEVPDRVQNIEKTVRKNEELYCLTEGEFCAFCGTTVSTVIENTWSGFGRVFGVCGRLSGSVMVCGGLSWSVRVCGDLSGSVVSVGVCQGLSGSVMVCGGLSGSVRVCGGLSESVGVCQSLWRSVRVCQGLWGSVRVCGVCQGLWGSVMVCGGLSWYVGVCQGLCGSVRVCGVCGGLSGSVKFCHGLWGSVRVCEGMWGSVRACGSLSESVEVCQGLWGSVRVCGVCGGLSGSVVSVGVCHGDINRNQIEYILKYGVEATSDSFEFQVSDKG